MYELITEISERQMGEIEQHFVTASHLNYTNEPKKKVSPKANKNSYT